MKGGIYAIAASVLLGSAVAGSIHDRRHAGHEALHALRRAAVGTSESATCDCYTTSYFTYYGEATLYQPNTTVEATSYAVVSPEAATTTSTSESSAAPYVAPTSSSSVAPPPPATTSTSSSVYYALPSSSSAAPYVAPSSSSAAPPASSSHSSSAPITSGSQWCMTYSPYTNSGNCKDAGTVGSDIASMAAKGFTSVRIYSTDCNGLANVGSAAKSNGLKLVLGVFISDTGILGAQDQVGAITSWAGGDYSDVEMIVIGNEAIFNGYCSASALASFISSAKSTLKAAGYSGPVTTTEPINILQENAESLCPVLDIVAANIHPFFNPTIDASSAGSFVALTLQELDSVCPGSKATYNLETGWPNAGDSNGVAVPGVSEQQTAIASIKAAAGEKSAFFSFVDDMWKAPGPLNIEQNWGCSQLFAGS